MTSIFAQFLKKDTKKAVAEVQKTRRVPKAKLAKLIFDALMQRLLHLFYLIYQITTMQRHITKITDIHFLLLFEQFYITKKSGELCRIFWIFCILFVNKD